MTRYTVSTLLAKPIDTSPPGSSYHHLGRHRRPNLTPLPEGIPLNTRERFMATEVVKTESRAKHETTLRRASALLRDGGLVAFPTETVYGVAACVSVAGAVDRLREIKQRPAEKAFTVHLGDRDEATGFVPELSGLARRFIRKGWPGPLTLIMTVEDPAAAPVMAGREAAAAAALYYDNTIGLRCPDHAIAQTLLRGVEAPVVAASANHAGNQPPHTAEEVLKDLDGKIDLLIDAGRTKYAQPSTIVRLEDSTYDIIREGVYDARTVKRLATSHWLFVCTGNTCRSPMAAAIAADLLARRFGCKVSELAYHGVAVSSAGTSGGYGGASEHAITAMRRRGIDLSGHDSATLTVDLIEQADHVFAMTRHHRERIVDMVPSATERVALLVEDQDVTDPMGGSEQEYEDCAKAIENGVRNRLKEVCP